ncbi:MAG: acyl-CoA thioesterase [Clostridia bacterium]|nr:acyl-CoA thioesterase [Clostridia bacterium]
MEAYIRKVQYHETDKMGVAHHSNFIKWMEEARVDFLDRIGYGYVKLEEDGIISPVLTIECEYKKPLHFGDEFAILPEILEFKGIRLVIGYTFTLTGETVATGKTSHCFLTPEGRPIALKRQFPEFDSVLKGLVKK